MHFCHMRRSGRGGAARALPSFANRQRQANPQQQGEAEGGVLPDLTDLVGEGPFEKDGSG
jgi:hypothetical protein